MRVCQVIDRLTGGGQERIAATFAAGLVGRVDRSALLATRSGGDYERALSGLDVDVYVGRRRSRWDAAAWGRMYAWLRAMDFDVVHTHSPGSLRAATALRRLPGLSYRIVSHLQMLPPDGTAFRDWAVRTYERSREDIDLAVVTNPTLRAFLVQSCGFAESRVVELDNPVDFAAWDVPRPVDRGDRIEIAMVAQWRAQKDHPTAIRATRLLLDRGVAVRLTFVGSEDAKLTAAGRSLALDLGLEEAVRFLGRQTDVARVLASSDLGLLTTHFEGLPVAVIEYCAAGLPSVVSSVEGTTHIISPENGIAGVPPSDPRAVADAVAALAVARHRRELGSRARVFMHARADRKVVLDAIVDQYDRLRAVPAVGSSSERCGRSRA